MAKYSPSSVIFLMALSFSLSFADPRIEIVTQTCTNITVSDEEEYKKYYTELVDEISHDIRKSKFGYRNRGNPPHRMFVLGQCMDDLKLPDCIGCYSRAFDLLGKCLPATGGRVYLDGCFVRADNFSFEHEIISNDDLKRCSNRNSTQEEFRSLAGLLITDIIHRAPRNGGFAVHHKANGGTTVYGLGICWATVDTDSCKLCLSDAAVSAFDCLPAEEGRAVNSGCFLRYSDHSFYNDPGLLAVRGAMVAYILQILTVVAVCLSAIGIGFCVGKVTYLHKLRKGGKGIRETSVIQRNPQYMHFKFSMLENATEKFRDCHKLGAGGYGEVFKGTLPDGREIAIKRLFISGKQKFEEIQNEMDVISTAQHKNLVQFLGCCFTNINCFLVYEFVANTSLDRLLFDPEKKKELKWKKRFSIILCTAEGLEYLHKKCCVIHRDIKASNILLDLKYRPKIADFGLAKFYSTSTNKCPSSTAIAGTLGYMAPEYIAKGRLTNKVDVYSFGVLVLEIVCGLQNNSFESENSLETLVTHTWKSYQSNTVDEIIDQSMEIADMEEIKRVIQVGLLCTQEAPFLRPTLSKVIEMLKEKHLELPRPTRPPFTNESLDFSSSQPFVE